MFIVVSLGLIPFAYIIGVLDKIKNLNKVENAKERLFNNLMFIPFGIPILIFDFLADMRYFWMNNFRTDLDVIIIPKEKSLITHKSIKEV